jgi:hypothetical protein
VSIELSRRRVADYEALLGQVLATPVSPPLEAGWALLVRQGLAAWLLREPPQATVAASASSPMATPILVPQRQQELVQAWVNMALGRYSKLIL